MADKKLFDNLYKVIKGNSGEISVNEGVFTEIIDLQIPRGYCARIRKVKMQIRGLSDQDTTNLNGMLRNAVVLDADDENSTHIPMFEVDHDVLCDFLFEIKGINQTGVGGYVAADFTIDSSQAIQWIEFPETLDAVTVRNIRCNSIAFGLSCGGENPPQIDNTVYFTYEKISADLYSKLLGIS